MQGGVHGPSPGPCHQIIGVRRRNYPRTFLSIVLDPLILAYGNPRGAIRTLLFYAWALFISPLLDRTEFDV